MTTETAPQTKKTDQKYHQTETKSFDTYEDARSAYTVLVNKLKCRKPTDTHDDPKAQHKVRVKLRNSGKFDLVTFELIKETNAQPQVTAGRA